MCGYGMNKSGRLSPKESLMFSLSGKYNSHSLVLGSDKAGCLLDLLASLCDFKARGTNCCGSRAK